MKKGLAIILSVYLILCLAACDKNENSSDILGDTSQIASTENQTSKFTEWSSSSGSSNSNKTTHTHSYSKASCTEPAKCSCGATNGSALGHSWKDATCQALKTCSVCKKTEGNKAEHIVEGTTCKWCKQVVVVNPNKVNIDTTYSCIGPKFYEELPYGDPPVECDCYILTVLKLGGGAFAHMLSSESNTPKFTHTFYHNGKYYRDVRQWRDICKTSYKITESEILVTLTYDYKSEEEQKFSFELLSDDTLRIKSISGSNFLDVSEKGGLVVGSIFYPNPHYHLI